MKLSIIIVSYNTKELLEKCLGSLFSTNLPQISSNEFEIIVVDNNSQDGTIEKLKTQMSNVKYQIRLIENKENLGFAKAVNQGIKESQGKYLLLLNPDTRLSRSNININIDIDISRSNADLLRRSYADQDEGSAARSEAKGCEEKKQTCSLWKMIAYLEEHSEVAAIGPKIKNLDGSLQPSFGNFPSIATEFFQTFYLHRLFPFGRQICPNIFNHHLFNKPHEVDWLTGACLLIRREILNQIGLLDEFYFMGVEDIDWCFRAKRAGYKIYYYPEVEILHHHQATTTSYQQAKSRILQEDRNLCYFYKKFWPERKICFWIFRGLILLRRLPSLIQRFLKLRGIGG